MNVRRFCLGILVALILPACDEQPQHTALGTLERDTIRLTAPASEIVTAIYVQEGDQVKIDTPLIQLDNRAAEAEVARIEADLVRSRAYLTQLINGARQEEVASAKARVDQAEATAGEAQKSYQRAKALVEQRLTSEAQLDQARAQRDASAAALTDAREQLLLLQHGTRQELISQAHAQVDEVEHSLAIARKHLSDLSITATRSGRVDALPWKLGERVTSGAVLVIILADDAPYVRAYAPETVRSELQVGRKFPVHIDGVEKALTGTLIHVQKEPAFSPHYALTEKERSRLMYLIKVQLDPSSADLPSGIPAQVLLSEPEGNAPQ